ncbi:MAG TPA: biopolymer transporter ExbD, partial [Candidatus Omnitrophica bacterium]|nr:biopolymer transporter ExbD [Candidatus Omnitrophota bacterium]
MYNFKDYWKKSTVTFKSRLQIKRKTMELTPLIDVVFLLLIFFMLTSSFISQPGIKINLPKALTGQLLQQDTLVLTITEDNRIYFNNKRILFKELKDKLK